jgi:hypothetical protein
MDCAGDVLKNKFVELYVPYQDQLFHIDCQFRDLVSEYTSAPANGHVMSGQKTRELLNRGLKPQKERDENLSTFIDRLMKAVPGGVALQAWLIENKLRAASASA